MATNGAAPDSICFALWPKILVYSYLVRIGMVLWRGSIIIPSTFLTTIDNFLQSIDDSSNSPKGHFRVYDKSSPEDFFLYAINGFDGTPNPSWYYVNISYLDSSLNDLTFFKDNFVSMYKR